MFKVSEVAEMLSVEKVKIFEALILHDEALSPYVTKERHLTYVSEVGVRKLEQVLFTSGPIEEEIIEEFEEEYIELSKDDQLDSYLKKQEEVKDSLRNELIELKRQLNLLDRELRLKDDAILNYQAIIKDDFSWMKKLDAKVAYLSNQHENDEISKSGFFNRLMK